MSTLRILIGRRAHAIPQLSRVARASSRVARPSLPHSLVDRPGARTLPRYHPAALKWALRRLVKDGETSYNELREVIKLPTVRHLQDYKNAFKDDGQGVQHGVLHVMDEQATREGFTPWARHGALVWDAMKTSEGIVSNALTGEILGVEWSGIDTFEHLSLSLKEMEAEVVGTTDGETAPSSATGGETAPLATAGETAPSATAAPKKHKLAKYWTEVQGLLL